MWHFLFTNSDSKALIFYFGVWKLSLPELTLFVNLLAYVEGFSFSPTFCGMFTWCYCELGVGFLRISWNTTVTCAAGPSVHDLDNITQLWKKYLKIKFTSDNNYSKLKISSTLHLEITKETWLIQGFPTVPRASQISLIYLVLILFKFSLKTLFNIHSFLHHMSKHFQTTLVRCLTQQGLSTSNRRGPHGLGDLTSDTQKKQTGFLC
jgi:hypothetical protein